MQGLLNLPAAIAKLAQTNFRMPPTDIVDAMLERDKLRKQARLERFEQLLAKVPDVETTEGDRL